MEISELIREAHATASDKGWWDDDIDIGMQLALIHSEVSEALEAWRDSGNNHKLYPGWYYGDNDKPEGFASELADICIRVADVCGYLRIDLETAVAAKLNYNKKRPRKHGGKLA